MSWAFYAIFLLACKSSYVLYKRLILRDTEKLHTITAALLYTTFWGLSLVYAFSKGDVTTTPLHHYPTTLLLVGGSIIFAVVLSLENRLIQRIDVAQFSLIAKAGTLFVVLGGWVLLGEHLSLIQLLGAVIVFASGLLVLPRFSRKTGTFDVVTILCLVFVLLAALAVTNEKFMLGRMNMSTYMVFGWGIQTVALWVFCLFSYKKWLPKLTKRHALQSLSAGLLLFGVGIGWLNLLVQTNNLPLSSMIDSFSTVLVVVGSIFLLKERDNVPKKVVATVFGIIGLVILLSQ